MKTAKARSILHEQGFHGAEAFRVRMDMLYCKKRFHCNAKEYFQYKFYNLKNRSRKHYLLSYHQRTRYDLVNTGGYAVYGADSQYTLFQDSNGCEQISIANTGRAELERFIKKHGTVIFRPACASQSSGVFAISAEDMEKQLPKKLSIIAGQDYLCEQAYGKQRQYTVFHDKIGREWMSVTPDNRAELESFIRKHGKVIFKPSCGSRGVGIFGFTAEEIDEKLTQKLAMLAGKSYLCEQYLIQHPKLAEMNPHSVNTIRVVSLCDGKSVKMLFGSLRTGAGDGVCDNMSGGGVGTVIDMQTGISLSAGIDSKCRRYFHHPVTGTEMVGFEIPFWDKVREMVTECALRLRADAILVWDIAITESGPVIIELNRHPEAGQYAQMAMNRPLGEEIIRYINSNRRRNAKKMPRELKKIIKKRH